MGLLGGQNKKELLEWQNLVSTPNSRLTMSKNQLLSATNLIFPRNLEIYNNCAKLFNSTTNIDTFFSNHDTMLQKLEWLSKIEKFVTLEGEYPSEVRAKLINSYDKEVKAFIDRSWSKVLTKIRKSKTEKGKENAVWKFKKNFEKYENRLNIELIAYYQNKVQVGTSTEF